MSAAIDPRRLRAVDAGMWLFLASLVMLFASLCSGYVLLRAGSEAWPTPWLTAGPSWRVLSFPLSQTIWLLGGCVAVWKWSARGTATTARLRLPLRWWPLLATFMFIAGWVRAASLMASSGGAPATSVAAASWFVLTGAVAVGVVGGGLAVAWAAWRQTPSPPPHVLRQLRRYWMLMLAFWVTIVVGMYVV